jgi:hypothetical protein
MSLVRVDDFAPEEIGARVQPEPALETPGAVRTAARAV